MPPLIYRAEAYDDEDSFREPVWTCSHQHSSVDEALKCGEEWLEEQGRAATA
jgi:hypothetical protein